MFTLPGRCSILTALFTQVRLGYRTYQSVQVITNFTIKKLPDTEPFSFPINMIFKIKSSTVESTSYPANPANPGSDSSLILRILVQIN